MRVKFPSPLKLSRMKEVKRIPDIISWLIGKNFCPEKHMRIASCFSMVALTQHKSLKCLIITKAYDTFRVDILYFANIYKHRSPSGSDPLK